MREALLIAKREFLEGIRSRAFRISTVLMPLMFCVLFFIVYKSARATAKEHLVIASNDTAFATGVQAELMSAKNNPPTVDIEAPTTAAALPVLTDRVNRKEIDGYLWLDMKRGAQRPSATLATRSSTDPFGQRRIEEAISRTVVRRQLVQRGFADKDVEALFTPVDLKTEQVKDGKATSTDSERSFYGAYGMIVLLYFTIFFYGTNVGRSVIEEKTSRIFEVLLTSAPAESFMLGKLLGVGATVLCQLAIWIALLAALSGSAIAARANVHGFKSFGIEPLQLVFFILFFVLGFLFYSALSAGVAAVLSAEQEMNQFAMLIMSPLVLAYVMMFLIFSNPNSALAIALSLFPPFTPIIMCLRMAVQMPPLWQPILSVILLIAAIYLVLRGASRVYRVGILMYGKRPTLPEMVRWLRYS